MIFLTGCHKTGIQTNLQTDEFVYWMCGPYNSENTVVTVLHRDNFSTVVLVREDHNASYDVKAAFDGKDFYSTIKLPFYNCDEILAITLEP